MPIGRAQMTGKHKQYSTNGEWFEMLNDVCVMTPAGNCKGWRCLLESSTSCAGVQVIIVYLFIFILLLWFEDAPHVGHLQLRSNGHDVVQ